MLEVTGVPYAMINSDNVVTNICMWDIETSNWQPPDGCTCVKIENDLVHIGMTYNSSGTGVGTENTNKWIYTEEES